MEHTTRCGECDQCITWELNYLSHMEEALWEEAEGDMTRYFNLMGVWCDLLIEEGLPR